MKRLTAWVLGTALALTPAGCGETEGSNARPYRPWLGVADHELYTVKDAPVQEPTATPVDVPANREAPVKYGWKIVGGAFMVPGYVPAPEKAGSRYGLFDTDGDGYPNVARAPRKPRSTTDSGRTKLPVGEDEVVISPTDTKTLFD